jgi:serine/threonine-protein kinase RsbW/stage II sporulation protein AB (anti-sigma F factor)
VDNIEHEVRLDLPCEPLSARVARNAVAAIAQRLGVAVEDVKIAVGEAVGNAVLHAYRGGRRGVIRVFARHERGRLLITVADNGIGMAPHPDSPGLRLGIPLITQLCDDVRFSSSDRGTEVSMSFLVPGSAQA